MAQHKEKTQDQVAAIQAKAVRFLRDVVGDEEKADEIAALTVSEYAERKNLRIANPSPTPSIKNLKSKKRGTNMDARSKVELLAENNDLRDLISDIWECVVDTDESDSKEDLFNVTEDVAELINEFDPEQFVIEADDSSDSEGQDEEAA